MRLISFSRPARMVRSLICGVGLAVGLSTALAAEGTAPSSPPVSTPVATIGASSSVSGERKIDTARLPAPQHWTKSFSEAMQGAALAAAALFFAWKWLSGYLAFDMTLEMSARRFWHTNEKDLLVVSLKLIKGDRESALLKWINFRLLAEDGQPIPNSAIESNDACIGEGQRMIRLTPGEATVFEQLYEIDAELCPKIVAHVIASSGFFDRVFGVSVNGHWRSTLISVPGERIAKPASTLSAQHEIPPTSLNAVVRG